MEILHRHSLSHLKNVAISANTKREICQQNIPAETANSAVPAELTVGEKKMKRTDRDNINLVVMAVIFLSSLSPPADASEIWQNAKPCGRQLPAFEAGDLDGCVRSFCGILPDQTSICACQESEDTGETKIYLKAENGTSKEWSMVILPLIFESEAFRVDAADLNGDGQDEYVLAVMGSQSQGMGVQGWSIRTWDRVELSEAVDVDDYGVMSYLTCPKAEQQPMLLGSRWKWGWEPRRGSGLYIAGRWYKFQQNHFCPVYDIPGVYHRYFFSLAAARGKELNQEKPNPVMWYSGKNARILEGPYPFE